MNPAIRFTFYFDSAIAIFLDLEIRLNFDFVPRFIKHFPTTHLRRNKSYYPKWLIHKTMEYKTKQDQLPPTPIVATSMHIKETNTSTFVTTLSLHSQHTFNNNCYNAGLRIRKINDNQHYNYFCGFYIAALLSRHYKSERINREFAKTQKLSQLQAMRFRPPMDTIATFSQLLKTTDF